MHRVLLKTTIATTHDDWSISRFSMLADLLRSQCDKTGRRLFEVEARDRIEGRLGDDVDLSGLVAGGFDQLWLFAVDVTGALTPNDVAGIDAFREHGGGCMLTRDHFDMGSCLTRLKLVGKAHHFHALNPEPEPERRARDDPDTLQIDWPNYHSGANGDFQEVKASSPLHPVMRRSDGGAIRYLPSHPHEGAVSVPIEAEGIARVLATGISRTTGRQFNIAVAFESDEAGSGRVLAEATFHRFADYNWDPESGAPSFVTEPSSRGLGTHPAAMEDTRAYAANSARWLAGVI
jgi:hypothetical protein